MRNLLEVQRFAQIGAARIVWGDLTVFIGPQATGKSLLAQLWKLALDHPFVIRQLRAFGYTWNDWSEFLELYFGPGYRGIWSDTTKVVVNGRVVAPDEWTKGEGKSQERVLYIPAQRVLSIFGGWPVPFFQTGRRAPFVVRRFSDMVLQAVEHPGEWLQGFFLGFEWDHIYPGVGLHIWEEKGKREIALGIGNHILPIECWSAGQREVTPLLMVVGRLLSPSSSQKPGRPYYKWVVVEEPEMGLHPQAIAGILQGLLSLLGKGYRVLITTHSRALAEAIWLIKRLQELKSTPLEQRHRALAQYLGVQHIEGVLERQVYVYFFKGQRAESGGWEVTVQNISTLDAWDDNPDIAEWGGLTTLTHRAMQVLAGIQSAPEPSLL